MKLCAESLRSPAALREASQEEFAERIGHCLMHSLPGYPILTQLLGSHPHTNYQGGAGRCACPRAQSRGATFSKSHDNVAEELLETVRFCLGLRLAA